MYYPKSWSIAYGYRSDYSLGIQKLLRVNTVISFAQKIQQRTLHKLYVVQCTTTTTNNNNRDSKSNRGRINDSSAATMSRHSFRLVRQLRAADDETFIQYSNKNKHSVCTSVCVCAYYIGKPCCRYFALFSTLYYFIFHSKNLPTLIKKFASFIKLSYSGMAVNPRNSNTGIWERIDDLHYVVVLAAIEHSNVSHLEYVRR